MACTDDVVPGVEEAEAAHVHLQSRAIWRPEQINSGDAGKRNRLLVVHPTDGVSAAARRGASSLRVRLSKPQFRHLAFPRGASKWALSPRASCSLAVSQVIDAAWRSQQRHYHLLPRQGHRRLQPICSHSSLAKWKSTKGFRSGIELAIGSNLHIVRDWSH